MPSSARVPDAGTEATSRDAGFEDVWPSRDAAESDVKDAGSNTADSGPGDADLSGYPDLIVEWQMEPDGPWSIGASVGLRLSLLNIGGTASLPSVARVLLLSENQAGPLPVYQADEVYLPPLAPMRPLSYTPRFVVPWGVGSVVKVVGEIDPTDLVVESDEENNLTSAVEVNVH